MARKKKASTEVASSSAQLAEPLPVNNGDIPSRVAQTFCEWMVNNDFIAKGRAMQNLKIRRLHLSWSIESNKVDCGVHVMRHMEPYMVGVSRTGLLGLMRMPKRCYKSPLDLGC